jgi:hypothetical protein
MVGSHSEYPKTFHHPSGRDAIYRVSTARKQGMMAIGWNGIPIQKPETQNCLGIGRIGNVTSQNQTSYHPFWSALGLSKARSIQQEKRD